MANVTLYPDRTEMLKLVQLGEQCLECSHPDCNEMTPEGMDVCADLPFWRGKPVTRTMLREWKTLLASEKNGKH